MTLDELIRYYHEGITERGGCGGPVMFACLLIVFLLMGCKTVTNEESYKEKHRIESLIDRMDSLVSKSQTIQQDSSWRETFIKELQSIKERTDTNHVTVVDTAGNVIKETIIINNTKEVTNESTRLVMEGMIHKIDRMDSVIAVQNKQISHMDSLLQQSSKETVVTKKTSRWQSLWQQAKGILIGIIITGVIYIIVSKKWLRRWRELLSSYL